MMGTASVGTALAAYGSIAFSPKTGAYGYSHGSASRSLADQTALRHCRKHAADCKVVVYVQNACAALAVGKGRSYGYGWSGTRAAAEKIAMKECSSRTSACRIRSWICSG